MERQHDIFDHSVEEMVTLPVIFLHASNYQQLHSYH